VAAVAVAWERRAQTLADAAAMPTRQRLEKIELGK